MKEPELKITRNYSFWKHPIKWFKDRKKVKMANFLINYQWEHGMREEVQQMSHDMMFYGSVIMKDGKRVDPSKFKS